MVLAAGLGTRLRPMTHERPKPAVPVANRPLAWFTLDHLRRFGIDEVSLNTHHLGAVLEDRLLAETPSGLRLRFFHEERLLGTGGGIRHAALHLAEEGRTVLVMNSDILFAPDLAGAIARHRALGAVATMVLRPHPDPDSMGSVEIDREGRVRRLLGQPASSVTPLEKLMFTGVHVLSPEAFADLPADGCVIRTAYRRWVDSGATVAGFVDPGPWLDLGTPRAYLEANLDLAAGRLAWPGIEGRSGSLVHPAARVSPTASLSEVVVGAGAVIGDAVRLERAVVWDGVEVRASGREVVLTRDRVVPVS